MRRLLTTFGLTDLGEGIKPVAINDQGEVVANTSGAPETFQSSDGSQGGFATHYASATATGINNYGSISGTDYGAAVWPGQSDPLWAYKVGAYDFAPNSATGTAVGVTDDGYVALAGADTGYVYKVGEAAPIAGQTPPLTADGPNGVEDVVPDGIANGGAIIGFGTDTDTGYFGVRSSSGYSFQTIPFFPTGMAPFGGDYLIVGYGGSLPAVMVSTAAYPTFLAAGPSLTGPLHANAVAAISPISPAASTGNSDWVVGNSDSGNSAFVAEGAIPTGSMSEAARLYDLVSGATGWTFDTATGVNSQGQIVGTGTLNGKIHGFLLTPMDDNTRQLGSLVGENRLRGYNLAAGAGSDSFYFSLAHNATLSVGSVGTNADVTLHGFDEGGLTYSLTGPSPTIHIQNLAPGNYYIEVTRAQLAGAYTQMPLVDYGIPIDITSGISVSAFSNIAPNLVSAQLLRSTSVMASLGEVDSSSHGELLTIDVGFSVDGVWDPSKIVPLATATRHVRLGGTASPTITVPMKYVPPDVSGTFDLMVEVIDSSGLPSFGTIQGSVTIAPSTIRPTLAAADPASTLSAQPGDTIILDLVLGNEGSVAISALDVTITIAEDAGGTGAATLLYRRQHIKLLPGSSKKGRFKVSIPISIASGQHFLIGEVTPIVDGSIKAAADQKVSVLATLSVD